MQQLQTAESWLIVVGDMQVQVVRHTAGYTKERYAELLREAMLAMDQTFPPKD